jgi:hypothetical protein
VETIESVRQAVRAWRREHRRGPLPVALRSRLAELSARVGEVEARRSVGVRPTTTSQRQRAQTGKLTEAAKAASRSAFVELAPEFVDHASLRPGKQELRIELAGPGGYRVRIDGVRDAAEVAEIVRAALRRGEE